jgi:hypothetical protein
LSFAFCLQSTLMCFAELSEKTMLISVNSINRLQFSVERSSSL